MKDKTVNGTKYTLSVAYGVLKQLENNIFELIDDTTMDKLKEGVIDGGGEVEDLEEAAMMKFFSGAELKNFIVKNRDQGVKMLAMTLRLVNDKSIGETYENRLAYVMDKLDYEDGDALVEYLNEMLGQVQAGRSRQGKSKTSSEQRRAEEAMVGALPR